MKPNRIFSVLLAILAFCAARPLAAQGDRLMFPGINWGESYDRTVQILRGMGYTPEPDPGTGRSTRKFVGAQGDSVLAAFDQQGGLEAVTYSARGDSEEQVMGAFTHRAQQIATALGEADSTAANLAIWVAGSGDELLLARDGVRLVEFYFSIEAAERLAAQVRNAGDDAGKGGGKADNGGEAVDENWYQSRIGGSRWSPLTVGESLAISYDPRTTTAAGRRIYDTWTRWDHAQAEENGEGEPFNYTIERMKIDCAGRRMMTLQIVQYMDGRVVRTLPVPNPEWEPTVPESMGEEVIDRFCQGR